MAIFNSLTYAKRLKTVGIPEQQAEIQVEMLAEIMENMENKFASKEDLKNLETRLDTKMDALETRLDAKIETVESVLSIKIASVDTKLNWLMSLVGLIGIVLAVLNFIHIYIHV